MDYSHRMRFLFIHMVFSFGEAVVDIFALIQIISVIILFLIVHNDYSCEVYVVFGGYCSLMKFFVSLEWQ